MYEPTEVGVRAGDILAGKFRIERVLGIGGMGVVVAAQHLQLNEKVAIKFLLPSALEHPEAVARFLREAKAAVRIKSEHVARVSDVGTLDNGAPYMVMEYLEGGDLSQWLAQRGVMSVEQAAEFVLQALEAIADAHGLGIIHRDMKPANLFCVRRSDGLLSVKVLDFGISKVKDPDPMGPHIAITAPASVMGSPLYMSPEQMKSSRDVDARTDIWSVGIILYELLTRVTPFSGDSFSEVCVKAASSPPPPIRSHRPDLPAELEAVILKCLEKNREDRYRNVGELAVALIPFAPKRARSSVERISRIISAAGLAESALVLPPSSEPVGVVQTEACWGLTKSRSQYTRVGAIGALVILPVLGVGALLWFFYRGYSDHEATEASSAILAATPVPEPVAASSATVNVVPDATSTAAREVASTGGRQAKPSLPGNAPKALPRSMPDHPAVGSPPPAHRIPLPPNLFSSPK